MEPKLRLDIQILRAVSVGAVVIFHLWPKLLPGGYIGVDIFFVISGYLISGHIYKQIQKHNNFSFTDFYSRRVRRLLPASSLVLLATLLATFFIGPWRMWSSTSSQVIASALGFQNWLLAYNSVDYFASTSTPSPVMHYWSLSLEEQFYLFWPLFLLLLWKLCTRKNNQLRYLLISIGCVALASFAISIIQTEVSQSFAYFNTLTHIWEFCLGAILALAPSSLLKKRFTPKFDLLAAIMGILIILATAFVFNSQTKFPGYAALLPVIGALLVIVSGRNADQFKRLPPIVSQPLNWVGDNSYSIYLWHWPPIVLLPFLLGHDLGNSSKLAILAGTLILAWFTTKFVETPIRKIKGARLQPKTFVIGIATVTLLVLSSLGLSNAAIAKEKMAFDQAQQIIDESINSANPCFGAAAMANLIDCTSPFIPAEGFGADFAANDWGTLSGTRRDGTLLDTASCVDFSLGKEPMWECKLGAPGGGRVLAVVGDSHALALLEPIVLLANKNGFQVQAYLQNSCSPLLPAVKDSGKSSACDLWRTTVAERISKDSAIDVVIATGFSKVRDTSNQVITEDDLVAQYANLYKMWANSGKEVYAIEDVPLTTGQNIPECVGISGNLNDPCSLPRKVSLGFDPVPLAVTSLNLGNVHLVDLTDQFCDADLCHTVIGGLIAYRDSHHVSGTFALTLLPSLERQISFK